MESHENTKPDETKPIFFAPIRFVSFVASMSVSAPGQSVDITPAPDKLNPDGERA